jgi:hypothetical protein
MQKREDFCEREYLRISKDKKEKLWGKFGEVRCFGRVM